MPLCIFMRSSRWLIRNTALQTMAQVSAISSTSSSAVILCRRSVDRMGRISMSVALQLQGGSDLAGAPGREQPGQQRRADGEQEGGQQHRQVEVGERGIVGRLLAHK